MLEKVDDPIEVLASFTAELVMPVSFKWKGREYQVKKLNLVHKERDGNDKVYYFSVSDEANYFRLAFFTRDLSWRIQEVFFEG